jgi:hypothetical protein
MSKEVDIPNLVNDALIVNGHSIAASKATEKFNTFFETSWKTSFNLSAKRQKETENYIGEKIWCTNKKNLTSDHSEIVVARELLREQLDTLCNLQFTAEDTLFIGATSRELNRYKSNPAMHFLFNNVEDKDNARNISALSKMFIKILVYLEMHLN